MNETLQIIAKRYSCRAFTDRIIGESDLRAIADAGIQAPSARNMQHWHISVVKNKVLLSEMETEGLRVMKELPDQSSYERIMGRGGKLFYNAQAVIFIAAKDAETESYKKYINIDLGIAAQNISLAATSLGIDNCHCGFISFCFSSGKAEEFLKRLKIPAGYQCGYGVLLGYGEEQGAPHLPDKSKISFIE